MTAPAVAGQVNREAVEALVFAATTSAHARGVAALAEPLGVDITCSPKYLEAVAADEAAQAALRAALDAMFAELAQLRAGVAR